MSPSDLLAHINAQHFECFLLTQPNRWRCKLLSSSNARRILSFATLANLLNPRITKLYFSRALSRKPYYEALLALVRKVNPPLYDRQREQARQDICYPIDTQARARVRAALESTRTFDSMQGDSTRGESTQERQRNLISLANPTSPLQKPQKQPNPASGSQRSHSKSHNPLAPIICLNPFTKSSRINLPLSSYITLAHLIAARYPAASILLLSYRDSPSEPPKLTQEDLHSPPPNLLIFENNENLANLIELLRLSCLLISPSTGTIHLADLLQIPSIGIYNRKDSRLWLGKSMRKDRLLLLETPLERLSPKQIAQAEEKLASLALQLLSQLLESSLDSPARSPHLPPLAHAQTF